MNYFRLLKNPHRGVPGLEWKLFKKLPMFLLGGAVIPLLIALSGRVFPPDGPTADVAKHISTLDIFSIAVGLTAWFALMTVGVGCVVVIIMKGPAYVADGYSPDDAKYLPRDNEEI
jgi:hypothetical protein